MAICEMEKEASRPSWQSELELSSLPFNFGIFNEFSCSFLLTSQLCPHSALSALCLHSVCCVI